VRIGLSTRCSIYGRIPPELSRACVLPARIIRQNMPLQAGTRLGPFEIIALIGAGGRGEVWLATELRLGRKVALKLLPADLTRDPDRIVAMLTMATVTGSIWMLDNVDK
jgi:serine/threonine protein kinase